MDDLYGFGRQSVSLIVGEEGDPGDTAPDTGEFRPAAEKYEIEGTIGSGGMGEVLLVDDRDLMRQVAMKVIRPRMAREPEHRVKFVAEAQATSQLEHPGIPPVHDIGVTAEGQIWFTMKLIRGKTLRELLKELLLGVRPVKREWNLHKLVTVLERVAEALHFAHEKGVIHRDLKPENIMLGEYGEVHVVDWGVAKLTGVVEEDALEEAVETAGNGSAHGTLPGTVKGTIPYMSPEQASGKCREIDRRSDVYALGCLLYEIVTLHPAFKSEGLATLSLVRRGEYKPVRDRNPRRRVPEALAELCARSMAKDPSDRPPTAKAFEEELRAWLDGRSEAERRHREAEALAEQGKTAARRFWAMKGELLEAEEAVEEVAKDYKPWQSVREKGPLLEAGKRVETLTTDLALAFAETVKLLEGALLREEGNATARRALAELWRGRLTDGERRGDRADTAYALAMTSLYDDGALADVIDGSGTLSLTGERSGAEAFLCRYVEREGILTPEEERSLGQLPVGPVELPMGSYLVTLRSPGCRSVLYPVHISRNREWRGTVRMRRDDEIGDGFVYVPGGPFVYGVGKETKEIDIPDFAIAKYPVTLGEYAEFLASLSEEEAEERKPQTPGDGPYVERGEDGIYRPLPVIVEGKARERNLEEHGPGFETRLPVMGVCFDDAQAYCAWKTRETGEDWRLPTEEQREKAARGVDGRRFPWGAVEDASLAKCRDSRDENAQPEPVGTFPTAESVYGMGDAAGNIWDWTDSWFDERRSLRVLRGGSWDNLSMTVQCGARSRYEPSSRHAGIGIRCARSLEPRDL